MKDWTNAKSGLYSAQKQKPTEDDETGSDQGRKREQPQSRSLRTGRKVASRKRSAENLAHCTMTWQTIFNQEERTMYITRDRETGNIIDEFDDITAAIQAVRKYEEEDQQEGTFTTDFYEIADSKGVTVWADGDFDVQDYPEHEIIEVPHQMPVKTWTCKSFAEAASAGNYETWGFERFANLQEAEEIFGGADEVPEELKHANFPAVVVTWPGEDRYHEIVPEETFDAEQSAKEYLAHDLNRMIVINNDSDAVFYIERYHDHQYIQVQRAAREIFNKHHEE